MGIAGRWGRLVVPAVMAMLFLRSPLPGGELWSWHGFDFTAIKTARLEATLHSRVRMRSGDLQQGRSGAILKFNAHPRIKAIGGYYYGKEEDSREEWQNFHRVFGGVEVPVHRTRAGSLTTRGLVERFFQDSQPGYSRYRHRARYASARPVGPYAQGEWFFDAQGLLSGRYSGGVRWRASNWTTVEAGYLYDRRRPAVGPSRHVIVTNFFFGLPKRKSGLRD